MHADTTYHETAALQVTTGEEKEAQQQTALTREPGRKDVRVQCGGAAVAFEMGLPRGITLA